MHGYDTIVGAWNEPRDWSAASWESVQEDKVKGSVHCFLNTGRVQFSRTVRTDTVTGEILQMGTTFQASLPKILYGKNSRTLPIDDHVAALAAVDQVVQQYFPGAMPVAEMTPRRIDATDDRALGDELLVAAALNRMKDVELRGKKPWVGQVGTISWPGRRGSHTNKAYSKYRESGDPEAIGTLRVERGAVGLKCIRTDYQKAVAASVSNGHLTIGQALECPGLSQAILGPFSGIVDTVLKEVCEVTVVELFTRGLAAGMKPARVASLIGYANVIQGFGSYQNTMLTRKGQYNLKKDFERIGCDPKEVEFGPLYMRWIGPPRSVSDEEKSALLRARAAEDEADQVVAAHQARKRIKARAKSSPSAAAGLIVKS